MDFELTVIVHHDGESHRDVTGNVHIMNTKHKEKPGPFSDLSALFSDGD